MAAMNYSPAIAVGWAVQYTKRLDHRLWLQGHTAIHALNSIEVEDAEDIPRLISDSLMKLLRTFSRVCIARSASSGVLDSYRSGAAEV